MTKNIDTDRDVLKYVGGMIRKRRRELKMSQEKLAEHANLHTTTISDIERGKSNLTIKSLESIASVLGCSESYLLPSDDLSQHQELRTELISMMSAYNRCGAEDKKKLIVIIKSLIKAFE